MAFALGPNQAHELPHAAPLAHPAPPPPTDLSPALHLLFRATHWSFYAGFIALPVLGRAGVSAEGVQVRLAGLVPLPPLVPKGNPLGKALHEAHPVLAIALLALVGLHLLGALHHRFVKRDGVLGRMLPG